MPNSRLATVNQRDPAMLYEQRWMYKMVRYDEGRVGKVVDMSRDGTPLCIRREKVRAGETIMVWTDSTAVELIDVTNKG